MIDEIKASKAQDKGIRAKELLDNETLMGVFAYLNDEYIDAWKRTNVNDEKSRERLWQAVQLLGKVKDHLRKCVTDGQIATRDLANIKYLKR